MRTLWIIIFIQLLTLFSSHCIYFIYFLICPTKSCNKDCILEIVLVSIKWKFSVASAQHFTVCELRKLENQTRQKCIKKYCKLQCLNQALIQRHCLICVINTNENEVFETWTAYKSATNIMIMNMINDPIQKLMNNRTVIFNYM